MIAIIKYNAGNIYSVYNAIKKLGFETEVTDKKEKILNAKKVILPGVGEASSAMNYLRERRLDQVINEIQQPLLGICLGLQLLCQHSEEGNTRCLGIFSAQVKKLPPQKRVPHIGWNNINTIKSVITKDIQQNEDVYFLHSYYASIVNETSATCDYILPFSAVLERDNFYATQFHPEKSGPVGERILHRFLSL